MIKAICDECGKETVMRYTEQGLERPPGWEIKTQFFPLNCEYKYRTFCLDCKIKIAKKVME